MANAAGDHAVVLGAGMAGLLAARVLSEFYRDVTVVERDALTGATGQRPGVPHGRHAHALLAKGQLILEDLFPGLAAELHEDGIPSGDLAGNLRWYFRGKRLQQPHTGLLSISATRPVLEAHVRARVLALPNVTLLDQHRVLGLLTTADNGRVTGVRVSAEHDVGETHLPGDLVVDATGRGSRTPVWLDEMGYGRPVEERVNIRVTYVTRHYRLAADPYGTDLSINPVGSPGNSRGAFFPKLADGSSMLSMTGILGDQPPTDREGFEEFAKTLAAPEIYEAIRNAEPLDDPAVFKFPTSIRRRYERMSRFPDGLLVIGDGVCSFNPVYGQGMTVAALEAVALRDLLGGSPHVQPTRFFRKIAKVVDVPWDISAGAD
ncbi:FAD-dependent oxidoreductase, partial [Saccharothrix sp. MB29]|nr:FAD-dependent oxidoreductase [Saccharothrix sp. MB29]